MKDKITAIGFLKDGVPEYNAQDLLRVNLRKLGDIKIKTTFEPYKRLDSESERGFFEGAMVATFAEYVYPERNPLKREDIDFVRQDIKKEFNGIGGLDMEGNYVKLPRSTKGSLKEVLTLCTQYLMENGYPIPDPELYKKWDLDRPEGNYWLWLRKNNLQVDGQPLKLI